ncbi:MAG TPA: glycosyltransferase family 4 protein [Sedimentisphaerales bacterium]|nr:glycosyltransferase family 4 protein [Sedimentisphaerales bacterium]
MTEELETTIDRPKIRRPRPVLIVSEDSATLHKNLLQRLLLGLADNSISPVVVCPPQYKLDSVALPAVEIIRHPFFNIPFIFNNKNKQILLESISKLRPNIIHCLCPAKVSLTRNLSKALNLNYILSFNSLEKHCKTLEISAKRCSAFIMPTQNMVENFKRLYPSLADRVKHINVGTFAQNHVNCLKNLNQIVCMVTAIDTSHTEKIASMLSAIRHLAIDGYEFMLVIIASGKSELPLRKLIHELALVQTITIIPDTLPWQNILAVSDIFIQPTPDHSFNPMLIEAMGTGLAIAGCKGGADDLIIENETAVIFDPKDELSIYSSIQKLFNDRDFARKLAQNNQEIIRKHHSVSTMINETIDVYNSILSK